MNNEIIITQKDYLRLTSLVEANEGENVENLEAEIERATVVSDDQLPGDIVTMNSTVEYIDIKNETVSVMTLVYPKDSMPEKNKVSILAPLASALIGLKVGQEIDWPFPSGEMKRLRVHTVVYQPEAEGNFEL